ncbi:MAG: hypothetical protein DI626_06430 [Micavibrio aeruginosavorus]|uniref:Uncharacterized protein n=1 Tax=Micavibrio aeruginosavorus TaxID=349221 RepID=A0A2W4ZW21_9BACT|nr:MAG: hypothetical protein DI626_06430 [Micavibrio aeruginosavorus]
MEILISSLVCAVAGYFLGREHGRTEGFDKGQDHGYKQCLKNYDASIKIGTEIMEKTKIQGIPSRVNKSEF